jgi:hypothetical protein
MDFWPKLESATKRVIRSPMELEKFRPGRAVRILADQPKNNETAFLRTWALAQLLAWAILDQRPGKRPPKEARLGSDKPKKRKIRTANAKLAGQMRLACLLDRHLSRGQTGSEEYKEKLRLMLALFMECGGFASCFKGWGARDLLYDAKDANRQLGYVYRIVDSMCRYSKRSGATENDPNFTIESAKSFVERYATKGYGPSKISKIWERYRNAAPYIFAVYRFFSFRLEKAKSIDEIVDWLEKFASDRERLARFLARAAFASDVLAGKARNVRQLDFENIERIAPPLRPFNDTELAIINNNDPNAPIA